MDYTALAEETFLYGSEGDKPEASLRIVMNSGSSGTISGNLLKARIQIDNFTEDQR